MNCPIDGATLLVTERSGIEIDYCPTCRGVWLDRGELDKIIERVAQQMDDRDDDRRRPPMGQAEVPYDPRLQQARPYAPNRERYDDDDDRYRGDSRYYQGKKKRGFLGEVFDIFD